MNSQSRHFRRVRTHTPIKRRLSATQIILLGFIVLIFIGTLLLTLPISSRSGTVTSVREASFTAVSATCVTGAESLIDELGRFQAAELLLGGNAAEVPELKEALRLRLPCCVDIGTAAQFEETACRQTVHW